MFFFNFLHYPSISFETLPTIFCDENDFWYLSSLRNQNYLTTLRKNMLEHMPYVSVFSWNIFDLLTPKDKNISFVTKYC